MVTSDVAAAEQSILGAMMLDPDARRTGLASLGVTDFWNPHNATIWTAIGTLTGNGTPVDPTTVLGELRRTGDLDRVGGGPYLHRLAAAPFVAASTVVYARTIRDAARVRRVAQAGQRLTQIAESPDPESVFDATAAELVALSAVVDERAWDEPVAGLSTWADFLAHGHETAGWLVPGLLARDDVVMILAPAGAGKSTLSRQLCLALAAGVEPFRDRPLRQPYRTLLIDLENAAAVVVSETRDLHHAAKLYAGGDLGGRAWFWHHPEGFNLRDRGDAAMLERVVADVRPDLVAMGSLYKAFQRGRDDWETAAGEVRVVLDGLRRRFGFALWLEHHMPKQAGGGVSGTPYGSAVWEWWPSVGRTLVRCPTSPRSALYELRPSFRGDRGVHDGIPAGLDRHGPGRWPWKPVWDSEELQMLVDAAS